MAATPVDLKFDAEGKESQTAPAAAWCNRGRSGAGTECTRLVYLLRREGLSSVFASQVVGRLGTVAGMGLAVEIGIVTPIGHWVRPTLRRKWREAMASLPSVLDGQVHRFPSLPSRMDWPMAEARILRSWLRRRFALREKPLIVQCRNATVTRMALWARRNLPQLKVVFDFRGVHDHEWLYKHGMTYETAPEHLKRHALSLAEEQRRAVKEADGVVCVSEAMNNFLLREYGIDRDKCLAVPCCVDGELFASAYVGRAEMRRSLGLTDRLVVTYCGSMERYQLPRESLRLFLQIQAIEPRAHFLVVTTNADAMRSAAQEVGVGADEMTLVSVPYREVPRYLAAADIGLLLRDRSPVNEVASPVKFGEYLASGTPVIISEGVGDYSALTQRERLGLVIPTEAREPDITQLLRTFLEQRQRAPEEWAKRCQRVAAVQLDLRSYLPGLLELYSRLGMTP